MDAATPPADRDDDATIDPAVIDIPTNEGVVMDETATFAAIRECVTGHTSYHSECDHWVLETQTRGEFAVALLAAVLVPATAEAIAAAHIERARELRTQAAAGPIAGSGSILARAVEATHSARVARSFAAGLSAGATRGDGDG